MFCGEYEHSLDTKGRMIIPAKLRDSLGETFMITKGLDGCLFVYSMDQWKEMEQKLEALPLSRPDTRAFVRYFFSGATETEPDKQGRVMIPQNLREHAGLTRDILILGAGGRLEVWDKDRYAEYLANSQAPEDLAAAMGEIGFYI